MLFNPQLECVNYRGTRKMRCKYAWTAFINVTVQCSCTHTKCPKVFCENIVLGYQLIHTLKMQSTEMKADWGGKKRYYFAQHIKAASGWWPLWFLMMNIRLEDQNGKFSGLFVYIFFFHPKFSPSVCRWILVITHFKLLIIILHSCFDLLKKIFLVRLSFKITL